MGSFVTNEHVQVSLFNKDLDVLQGNVYAPIMRIDPEAYGAGIMEDNVMLGKYGDWSYCDYSLPENPEYSVDLRYVTINDSLYEEAAVEPGSEFTVDMIFENTGNTRLFARGQCRDLPEVNIGTQAATDRISLFGDWAHAVSGWSEPTRVSMVEDYVEPGEEMHFTFTSIAPEGDNIYREFFQPVVEWIGWLDEPFVLDFAIGEPTDQMRDDIQYVIDMAMDAASLEGLERKLEIDLYTQRMYAKFGDLKVWSMDVSSGKYATPTPRGDYTIFQKQELRIGQAAPYYRMPWWQFWDARGYGIHGLPYLATDGGVFWKEANSHMGIPVSHGCVRTLDRDAETLYMFTDIGTPLWIH